MGQLEIVTWLSDGLVGARDAYGYRLWARWRARKDGICIVTGKRFKKGAMIFGPLTNGQGRGHRVLAEWVDKQKFTPAR
jgi:hypothetical protein